MLFNRIMVSLDRARPVKTKLLFVIFLLLGSSHACVTQIPESAREMAISALCDFPAFSGENMCQRVDITKVMVEHSLISANQSEGSLKKWCIELNYVDYTGEHGFACVWLVGPSEEGEYKVNQGPLFNVKCVGSR